MNNKQKDRVSIIRSYYGHYKIVIKKPDQSIHLMDVEFKSLNEARDYVDSLEDSELAMIFNKEPYSY